jgi:hypothetical protein
VAQSGPLSPIGHGVLQSYTLESAPAALGDVTLAITAVADLGDPGESVFVLVNGQGFGTIFGDGSNCPHEPDVEEIVIGADAFNTLADGGDVLIMLIASGLVAPDECGAPWIAVEARYATADLADCNGNGVPDACDIASGFSQDADGNGIPDTCR